MGYISKDYQEFWSNLTKLYRDIEDRLVWSFVSPIESLNDAFGSYACIFKMVTLDVKDDPAKDLSSSFFPPSDPM